MHINSQKLQYETELKCVLNFLIICLSVWPDIAKMSLKFPYVAWITCTSKFLHPLWATDPKQNFLSACFQWTEWSVISSYENNTTTEGNVCMEEKEWEIAIQGTASSTDLEEKIKLSCLFIKLLK